MKPKHWFLSGLVAAIGTLGVWHWLEPGKPVTEFTARAAKPSVELTRLAARAPDLLPSPQGDTALDPSPQKPTRNERVNRLTAEIRAAFESFSIDRLDVALTQLLPALVDEDASVAARLAESIAEPNLRAEVMHLVARLWGRNDAEAALAWAGSLKIEYEREATLTDAGAELAREDPARALQLSARSFRQDEPSAVLENLAHQWAEKNFPAALAWTLANGTGPQREEMLARFALVEAGRSPVAAVQLVTEQMTPGETQNEAAISVLHQWAQRDFHAASIWVSRFPDSPLRERATAELTAIAKFRLASVH